ncbi:hypothetical protein L3X38_036827 [Prunus dulcis]|uniref:Uncharacterized protein n=1 Tax=Prunus dulcis TaxID=3755 RepID=A0AAD4V262_PRUDU|nr:hypothetical protein L3X38_036827 [Prunus dulcis]
MIEKRMLVGSSQTQPQIRPLQQVCNTVQPGRDPARTDSKKGRQHRAHPGVNRIERRCGLRMGISHGNLWTVVMTVTKVREDDYCSLMAARKEEKEITRRLRESTQTTDN